MDDIEKRQTDRKRADYVVEFYDPEGAFLIGVGKVLDLSPTGVQVESSLHLKTGQALRIHLRRGEEEPFELSATVARQRRKGVVMTYGLKFNR